MLSAKQQGRLDGFFKPLPSTGGGSGGGSSSKAKPAVGKGAGAKRKVSGFGFDCGGWWFWIEKLIGMGWIGSMDVVVK